MAAIARAGSAPSAICGARSETREVQRIAVEETRLGIPLLFAFDVIHGHRTVFPIPLAEAAAFDPALWERTARAAAVEAAADGLAMTFAPMLDVARDPRWGRIAESPGEDPWLAARFAEAKVRGFQGDDLAPADNLAATAKHLAAYGAATAGRDYASVDISERSFHEVYLPPFRAAVAPGVAAIMPAFHDLAGVPMTANAAVLRDLVRERWGFDGVIVSDHGAVAELVAHGVAEDLAEAAALALRAGVDIDLMGGAYARGLPLALERGLVAMAQIDAAVRRVLALKAAPRPVRRPLSSQQGRAGAGGQLAAHRQLARDAARRSIVLLTNRAGCCRCATGRADRGDRPARRCPRRHARAVGRGRVAPRTWSRSSKACARRSRAARSGTRRGSRSRPRSERHRRRARSGPRGRRRGALPGRGAAMSGEAASRARPDLPGRQPELAQAVLGPRQAGRRAAVVGPPPDGAVAVRAGARGARHLVPRQRGRPRDRRRAERPLEPYGPAAGLLAGRRRPDPDLLRPAADRPARRTRRCTTPASTWICRSSRCSRSGTACPTPASRSAICASAPSELRPGEAITIEFDGRTKARWPARRRCSCSSAIRSRAWRARCSSSRASRRSRSSRGSGDVVRFTLAADDLAFLGPDLAPRLEPGMFELFVGRSAAHAKLLRTSVRLLAG